MSTCAMPLDTMAIARKLEDSGFDSRQAQAIAAVQRDTWQTFADSQQLATKRDLLELELRITRNVNHTIVATCLGQSAVLLAAFAVAVVFLR